MNSDIFGVTEIVSKTNSTIVKISKLENKKYRNIEKLFICNGIKLFLEAISFNAKIKYIVLNNKSIFDAEIVEKIKAQQGNGVSILCVSDIVFDKLTDEQAPQGIITVCSYFEEKHSFFTNAKNKYFENKIMLFESIRDPGNVGTIIRNAAAFGIERLIFSSDCADIYSTKVIRAAMGAVFKVNIDVVNDFNDVILSLKKGGKRVLGAALKSNSLVLGKDELSTQDVVVIGNEGHGLSSEVLSLCDNTLFIPMCENTESLNAAIATAIIMWEFSK
ncbi:MAG: RNA methyltransferase [Clostridia bacterium]|nr:RNA methyltransferase [Clostridia bacterium]